MKIWKEFKEFLITNAVNGSLFYTPRTLPKTDEEKYWYNRGLQDSLMDLRRYEALCKERYGKIYNSLIRCLSDHGIMVHYEDLTDTTHISITKDVKIPLENVDA